MQQQDAGPQAPAGAGDGQDLIARSAVLLATLTLTLLGYLLTAWALHMRWYWLFAFARFLTGVTEGNVAVARAIAGGPDLLLADEPTGNLDPENAGEVLALLDGLRADGTTVVVVTHDPAVAARAGRRLTMDAGLLHDEGALR